VSACPSPAPRAAGALAVALCVALGGCGGTDERRRGVYDPRAPVVSCLRDEGLPARNAGPTTVVVNGVRIEFSTTPGEAEALQIRGRAQGAEQIGRALVFVGRAPGSQLSVVEECVDR
jgi:hypothetical protein